MIHVDEGLRGPPAPALCLGGATASGKSALAMELARRLNGEIVSVDSMQVYRGLDIGTAKPTDSERREIPHHLIDVVEPGERFDAARFLDLARRAVAGILQRGRIPILCGGTGLYFRVWFEGLSDGGASDGALRSTLEALPLEDLVQMLAGEAPELASRIDLRNPRRVVRALERVRSGVYGKDGVEGHWIPRNKDDSAAALEQSAWMLCVKRDADELRRRIDERVDGMFARGLVEEARRLLAGGLDARATCRQALGYRQVFSHLEQGRSISEVIPEVKVKTWQFARRQRTWFRHQLPVHWLEWRASLEMEEVADQALQWWSEKASGGSPGSSTGGVV